MSVENPLFQHTIKMFGPDGADEMFNIRSDDSEEFFTNVAKMKKWLASNGYTANAPRRSPQASNAAPAAANVPTCQYHGPMKESRYGGFFCPKKLHDGSYCQSKTPAAPTPAQAQAVANVVAPAPLVTNGTPPAPPAMFDDAPPPDFDSYYSDQN